MPSVSVLLPVRDCEGTVVPAIRSVRRQSFEAFELVVVDDGSRDGTREAVRAAAEGDPRVRVLRRSAAGIAEALDAGLECCRAPLVARMDGDDLMHPDRLGEQIQALGAAPETAVVSTRVQLEPADSTLRGYVEWLNGLRTSGDIARAIFVEAPLCHPSVMFRAGVVRAAGGYRKCAWPEDWDLWLRLHLAGHRMEQVPRVLHVWRDWPGRVTRTDPRCSREAQLRLRAHFLAKVLPGRARIWGAGRDGRRLARELEAEGVALRAFVDIDPAKIGGVRRGRVPVVGPEEIGPPDTGCPIVAAVGVPGAREEIRERLSSTGYVEGVHFVCAA